MKQRIKNGRFVRQLYCVTIPQNVQNVMDIVPAKALKRRPFCEMTVKIIGIAKGESASKELVRQMIEELYRETGGFDAEQYFE